MKQQKPAAISQYTWGDYPAGWTRGNSNLNDVVLRLAEKARELSGDVRVIELGCGNGSFANMLSGSGFDVTGVDPSPRGIQDALVAYPQLNLHLSSTEDDLASEFGQFPLVISLEVIEHVFDPWEFAAAVLQLVEPGGTAIISTPYHGYWKNLALAASGKMDRHFTALWKVGHIKFFSVKTLRQLLRETGFASPVQIHRVGRVRPLAKSMVAVATRPL